MTLFVSERGLGLVPERLLPHSWLSRCVQEINDASYMQEARKHTY